MTAQRAAGAVQLSNASAAQRAAGAIQLAPASGTTDFGVAVAVVAALTIPSFDRLRDVAAPVAAASVVAPTLARTRVVAGSTASSSVTIPGSFIRTRDVGLSSPSVALVAASLTIEGEDPIVEFVSSTSSSSLVSASLARTKVFGGSLSSISSLNGYEFGFLGFVRIRGFTPPVDAISLVSATRQNLRGFATAPPPVLSAITNFAVGPVAVDDGPYGVPYEGVRSGDVSVNDTGGVGLSKYEQTGLGPFWGEVVLAVDGGFDYIADLGTVESDVFQYRIRDDDSNVSNTATVSLVIRPLGPDLVATVSASSAVTPALARIRDLAYSFSSVSVILADLSTAGAVIDWTHFDYLSPEGQLHYLDRPRSLMEFNPPGSRLHYISRGQK